MACVKCAQGDHSAHVDVYQGTACIGCGCTGTGKGGYMITPEIRIRLAKKSKDELIDALGVFGEALQAILNDEQSDCRKSLAVHARTLLAQVEGKGTR